MSNVHVLHTNKRINTQTALELAEQQELDAVLIIGLKNEDDGSKMALIAGGEGDVMNYGLMYWMVVEAQNNIHNSIFED